MMEGTAATPHKKLQIRRNTKIGRVLQALSDGRSYNRFEATRELHDWALHSTVSALEKHGISVSRQHETVPGYEGNPAHVCRYWLQLEERKKAKKLLGLERDREGEDV